MEKIFARSSKIILDTSGPGGPGVVPYLPLNTPGQQPTRPAAPATTTGGPR